MVSGKVRQVQDERLDRSDERRKREIVREQKERGEFPSSLLVPLFLTSHFYLNL